MVDDGHAKIIEFYKLCSDSLVGYAKSYTGGDEGEAEEFVDEAFYELCRQWSRCAHLNDGGLYGWLRTVVRCRAIDEYRKRRRIMLVDPLEGRDLLEEYRYRRDEGDPVHALLAGEQAKVAKDLVELCQTVIYRMPEPQRLAIVLRGEGLTSPEIGVLLGITPRAVRGHWARAVKQLNASIGNVIQILDEMDDPDGRDA